jgi:hypothetical protein
VGVALLLQRFKPWISSLLACHVMPSALSSGNALQVWPRLGHLSEFDLMIALILLVFMAFPGRIDIAIAVQGSVFADGFAPTAHRWSPCAL